MKKLFCVLAASVFVCCVHAQGIAVNSDGTHSVIMGNVIVNPNGTHSIITGNVVVNPDGTHSVTTGDVIVNPDGTHTQIIGADPNEDKSKSAIADNDRAAGIERKFEKKAVMKSLRETKRDIRRQKRQNH